MATSTLRSFMPQSFPGSGTVSPSYLSSIFPNGIPQAGVATSSAPQAAAYTANATTASPYTTGTSLANPYTADTSGLGANALVQQVLGAEQPIFAQQQKALTDNLANAGIVGGSTAGALGDLANSQILQSLGILAPMEQTAQQTLLGANEFNAGQKAGTSLANAQMQNATNQFNTGNLQNASQFNANALNNMAQYNSGLKSQNSQFNAQNQLGVNDLNAQILNQNSQFNTQNALNAGQYDTGTANTILGQLLGYQNQDYLQQLNNQLSLAQTGQQGQTGAFQPVFQQPSAPNFSGLAGAFGSSRAAQSSSPGLP